MFYEESLIIISMLRKLKNNYELILILLYLKCIKKCVWFD
jgi:hypothetical protein